MLNNKTLNIKSHGVKNLSSRFPPLAETEEEEEVISTLLNELNDRFALSLCSNVSTVRVQYRLSVRDMDNSG